MYCDASLCGLDVVWQFNYWWVQSCTTSPVTSEMMPGTHASWPKLDTETLNCYSWACWSWPFVGYVPNKIPMRDLAIQSWTQLSNIRSTGDTSSAVWNVSVGEQKTSYLFRDCAFIFFKSFIQHVLQVHWMLDNRWRTWCMPFLSINSRNSSFVKQAPLSETTVWGILNCAKRVRSCWMVLNDVKLDRGTLQSFWRVHPPP